MSSRRGSWPTRVVPSPDGPSVPAWIATVADGIVLHVRVQPGASHTRLAGIHDDVVKVQVRARPVEGAANRALETVLADLLDVRPSAVRVSAGSRSREKRVHVDGIDAATVVARLRPFIDKAGGAH